MIEGLLDDWKQVNPFLRKERNGGGGKPEVQPEILENCSMKCVSAIRCSLSLSLFLNPINLVKWF